jgi:enamine deaminase RidA (YjgF/YER057c/UK114 family)
MSLECINPEDLPTPVAYSHLVVASGTRLVFAAGQEPEDERGNLVGPGDLAAPADSLLGVATLARPEFLIEVDAVAVIDD